MRVKSSIQGIREQAKVTGSLYVKSVGITLDQIYDNAHGTFSPNHSNQPAIVGIMLKGVDPNTEDQKASDLAITSVTWYFRAATGKQAEITSSDSRFVVNADHTLTVKYNLPVELTGSEIVCDVTYTDPVTGDTSAYITLSMPMRTTLSTVTALSLLLQANGKQSVPYINGTNYVINPLITPNDAAGSKWKRGISMQLYNGGLALPNAHDASGDTSARNGSAFYFFSYIDSLGVEHDLGEDVEWFDGTQFPDGSFDPDCVVDLAHIHELTLVCNAGFIPYGETENYLDESGHVKRYMCKDYLKREIKLGVHVPVLEHVDIVPIALPQVDQKYLRNGDKIGQTVNLRRCVIKADGLIINELTNPNTGNKDMVDLLFDVRWYNQSGSQIATGEVLSTSLTKLGCSTQSDIKALPGFSVDVTPRFDDLFGNNYCVEMDPNGDNPVAQICHGNPSFLDHLDPVIFDTTDNTDESGNARTTYPAKKLMRNNLLRYASGYYAPTVGITEDMKSECMNNALYSDAACKTLVYASGAYDAKKEWETVDKPLMKTGALPRTLYKKDAKGNISAVSHKLRPWETTETKYSIGVGYMDSSIYFIDNVKGKSGKKWKGVFTDVKEWDGIDLTKYELKPTALGPGAFTTVGGKARNFFYLYEGEAGCKGACGATNNTWETPNLTTITPLTGGRTYPINGSQIDAMKKARANNKDVQSPVPMAEAGFFALNAFISMVELRAKTQYISDPELFGSGISSNDAPNASTFYKLGGVEYKKASDSDYTFATWSDNMAVNVAGVSGTTSWSNFFNAQTPKVQCMEAQMAASVASELGIEATTSNTSIHYFYMYGQRYYYMDVPNMPTLKKGCMNARVYKMISLNYTDATNGAMNVQAILRMSLFAGAELSGDCITYDGGGAELVATVTSDGATNGAVGNQLTFYLQPDQSKWAFISDRTKSGTTTFGFEDKYIKIFDGTKDGTVTVGGSWRKNRISYTPIAATRTTGRDKGDCMWISDENYFSNTVGQRVRLAVRFGFYASYSACAPRSLCCYYPVSISNRSFVCRAQACVSITQ